MVFLVSAMFCSSYIKVLAGGWVRLFDSGSQILLLSGEQGMTKFKTCVEVGCAPSYKCCSYVQVCTCTHNPEEKYQFGLAILDDMLLLSVYTIIHPQVDLLALL